MQPTIIAYIQLALLLLGAGFVFYQNRILKTHIASLESFNKIFDLDKVHQFVKMREQTFKDEAMHSVKDLEEKLKSLDLTGVPYGPMLNEVTVMLLLILVVYYPHERRISIVETHCPKSKVILLKTLETFKEFPPSQELLDKLDKAQIL